METLVDELRDEIRQTLSMMTWDNVTSIDFLDKEIRCWADGFSVDGKMFDTEYDVMEYVMLDLLKKTYDDEMDYMESVD